ncbi:hypothetical protein [Streptomyces sp. NPDC053755]|uniref:hypothetical protein n=1 Tax=Streptomyces sp. NPDC053755 TaxID=3155815 RepID=UPI0034371C9E
MGRSGLPYLFRQDELLRKHENREPVVPRDGAVRVFEHSFDRALDGRRGPSYFLVWTPRP